MVEHHRLDPEGRGQLHQAELLDLPATRPRVAQQDGVRGWGHATYPTGSGGPEAGGERCPRRQNGYGEKHEADERSNEGLPVLTSGPEQSGDQDGRTHHHRDDAHTRGAGPVS